MSVTNVTGGKTPRSPRDIILLLILKDKRAETRITYDNVNAWSHIERLPVNTVSLRSNYVLVGIPIANVFLWLLFRN